jgi:hypothetical protein
MTSFPDTVATEVLGRAMARLELYVRGAGPVLSGHVLPWMSGLALPGSPHWSYFIHQRGFPFLALPWWLEESIAGKVDSVFQEDLILSSMSAYYYIRLVDQIMDERDAPERALLPAAGVFLMAFLEPYRQRFPPGDPFHEQLAALWSLSAEVTLDDGMQREIDETAFRKAGGRKQCAALVPVEAVLHFHGRTDLSPAWENFFRTFGLWHQMEDDVFDWKDDIEKGRTTYLISEARRHDSAGTSAGAAAWILREGLQWAFECLEGWWADANQAAKELGCPQLQDWMVARKVEADGRREEMLGLVRKLREMTALFARAGDKT